VLDENKALVRRAFRALWMDRNWPEVDEVFAADFVCQTPPSERRWDREAAKGFANYWWTVFPDMQLNIKDQIAEEDRVVSFYSGTGTHSAESLGVAATGRRVSMNGIVVSRVAEGKVAEEWYWDDYYTLLKQLGAVPAPAGAAQ